MRNTILALSLLLIQFVGFAQTDFREGYVITNNGDTLSGLVNYRQSRNAYRSCDFKTLKDAATITHSPGDLSGYGFVDDKVFESKEITPAGQDIKTVFLEVLVDGEVTLYRFEGTFWIEKDGQLRQLINETKVAYVNNRKVVRSSNQHIGTLQMLLFDCAEIRMTIQKTRLQERPLTDLVERYNKWSGSGAMVYKNKKPWFKAFVGASAGASSAQIEFQSSYAAHQHLLGSFESSNSLVAGVSLDMLSPRLNERLSFHADILHVDDVFYHYNLVGNGSVVERNYITIELQQLKVPLGLRYTFPERKFTPYFNLGLSSTVNLKSNATWLQELKYFNVVRTSDKETVSIKGNQLGYWGGLGVLKSIGNHLSLSLELRCDRTNGIAPFSVDSRNLKSQITNLQVVFGMRTK